MRWLTRASEGEYCVALNDPQVNSPCFPPRRHGDGSAPEYPRNCDAPRKGKGGILSGIQVSAHAKVGRREMTWTYDDRCARTTVTACRPDMPVGVGGVWSEPRARDRGMIGTTRVRRAASGPHPHLIVGHDVEVLDHNTNHQPGKLSRQ
jgi:hypothetical protein